MTNQMSNIVTVKLYVRDANRKGVTNFPIRGQYVSGDQVKLNVLVEKYTDEKGYVLLQLLAGAQYEILVMNTSGRFESNATISTDDAARRSQVIIGLPSPFTAYNSSRELRVVDLNDKPVAKCKYEMKYRDRKAYLTVGEDGKKVITSLIGEPVTITLLKRDNSEFTQATFTYTSHRKKESNFKLKAPIHQTPAPTAPQQPTSTPAPITPPTQGMNTFLAESSSHFNGLLVESGDYVQAATSLQCEVGAIKAVAKVESPRGSFSTYLGRQLPTILYERHYFRNFTSGQYTSSYPNLSGSQGNYGLYSAQYPKLEQAMALNQSAALKSCSWGKFQLMGANFTACGFSSVENMVNAMCVSEKEHLKAFVNFIKADSRLLRAIQHKNWATFAYYYNGSHYAENQYDTKMQDAYNHFVAHPNENPS
jgi:biotin carboxyl carrier protein